MFYILVKLFLKYYRCNKFHTFYSVDLGSGAVKNVGAEVCFRPLGSKAQIPLFVSSVRNVKNLQKLSVKFVQKVAPNCI